MAIIPFDEMDQMMREFWPMPALRHGGSFIPAVDVYETKDSVVVETPLAGIDPKDVKVEMEGNMLVIFGESKKEREVDEKNYYRKECRSGSFHRALRMPTSVDANKIKAEYENGVLKITAPKQKKEKSHKIEVKINKHINKQNK